MTLAGKWDTHNILRIYTHTTLHFIVAKNSASAMMMSGFLVIEKRNIMV
jgi:hypothetical protein